MVGSCPGWVVDALPMVAARVGQWLPGLGMNKSPMVAAATIRRTVAATWVRYGQVANGGSCCD